MSKCKIPIDRCGWCFLPPTTGSKEFYAVAAALTGNCLKASSGADNGNLGVIE